MIRRIRSTRDERQFEGVVRALLTSTEDGSPLDRLSTAQIPPPYAVRLKVVYSRSTPQEVLGALAKRHGFSVLEARLAAFAYEKNRHSVPFVVAPLRDPEVSGNVATIVSICKSEQWRWLRTALRRPYPSLVPILLSQAELVRTVGNLKRFVPPRELLVTGFSAKERLRHGTPHRRRRSVREWTFEQLDEVLGLVEERQQFLTSLDIQFASAQLFGQTWKIRKEGEVALNGGFRIAYDAIVLPMARIGSTKLRLFSGRGRREAHYDVKPVAIQFAQPVLGDVAVVRQFVQVLGKYPHAMHTVLHGNPYAQVRLTDLLDGSSIDVWALEPSRIALVPGLKASEAAFNRLVQYIFDSFREGTIAGSYGEESRS
jgi:hypothetical protein